MKRICTILTACLLWVLQSTDAMAKASENQEYVPAIEHIKTLPKPPAGFQWAVNQSAAE